MRLKGRGRRHLPLGRAKRRFPDCLSFECHLNLHFFESFQALDP